MQVSDYDQFVHKTTQFASRPQKERRAIAFYGLVSEIGSLIAAVKKKLLSEGGETSWDQANDEIKEEIGNSFWYCYASAQAANDGVFDVLAHDIENLQEEIGKNDERARTIALVLDPEVRRDFLEVSKSFPPAGGYSFDDYQKLAYKTARTDGRILLEVCIAVIWQLGAELLRPTLPPIELKLNKNIADRPTNIVLGEIAWHLSAMASLYNLSLDAIIATNCQKVNFRSQRGTPTPLHDADRDEKEQFPRSFDVSFIRISPGQSRMYVNGHPLGDDLTDNAYTDDGYRFHDVIHLALIAYLGWSPVMRGLMRRKRKSGDDQVDEVEDGGRAKVVEELVIKAIHSEGDKQAKAEGRCVVGERTRLFPHRSLITFRMLKTLKMYVDDLEVAKNNFWEWEDAIFRGCEMFFLLSKEQQGTVHLDLNNRTLTFTPHVSPGVQGITVGIGMGTATVDATNGERDSLTDSERDWAFARNRVAETIAAKRAILNALQLDSTSPDLLSKLEVRLDGARVYVKAHGPVLGRAWQVHAIDYKAAIVLASGQVICTASAIADMRDVSKR